MSEAGPFARRLAVVLLVLAVGPACTADDATRGGTSTLPITPDPSQVTVPYVLDMTTAAAAARLGQAGLLLEVTETLGGTDQTVARQYPVAGSVVGVGTIVEVAARCYPAPCPLPGEGKTIFDPCTCAAR